MHNKSEILPFSEFKFKKEGVSYLNCRFAEASRIETKEEFILKPNGNSYSCAFEKLSYDLLALCGVNVPQTYLVYEEKNKHYWLASRKEKGYQDLSCWLLKINNELKDEAKGWLQQQAIPGTNGENKPIVGLFENVAVFTFLQIWTQ